MTVHQEDQSGEPDVEWGGRSCDSDLIYKRILNILISVPSASDGFVNTRSFLVDSSHENRKKSVLQ